MKNRISAVLILTAMAICLFFTWHTINASEFQWFSRWTGLGRATLNFTLTFAIAGIAALVLIPRHRNLALTGATFCYLAYGAGLAATIATLFLGASCYAMGTLVFRRIRNQSDQDTDPLLRGITGLAIWLGIFYLLALTPYNWRITYLLLLASPVVYVALPGLPVLQGALRRWWDTPSDTSIAGFIACFFFFFVARYGFFPTVGYDDNALHLKTWTDLLYNHARTFDLYNQIWSTAPFTSDLLHGIISVLAGDDGRPALNIALLAIAVFSLYRLAAYARLGRASSHFMVCLFLTTPILLALLCNLQTELIFLALIGMAACVLCADEINAARWLAFLSTLSLLIAIKLTGVVIAAFFFLALIARFRMAALRAFGCLVRNPLPAVCVIALVFFAFVPYAFTWIKTGNPLFPLYNGYFKSPLFPPYNFFDGLYVKGATLHSLYGMFFNTGGYYESANYVGGFQYLFLLPIALVCIAFLPGTRQYKWAFVPAAMFGLVMFVSLQYYRYLAPTLLVCSFVIGGIFFWFERRAPALLPVAWLLAGGFALINALMAPGISWYFTRPPEQQLTIQGKQATINDLLPEQALNAFMNQNLPGEGVLLEPSRPFGATLAARGWYTNWYSPPMQAAIGQLRTVDELRALAQQHAIHFAYANSYALWQSVDSAHKAYPTYAALLTNYLTTYGEVVRQVGGTVLYHLQDTPVAYPAAIYSFTGKSDVLLPDVQKAFAQDHGTLIASKQSKIIAIAPVTGQKSFRYTVDLGCPVAGATFIAQINWKGQPPYYRLISCDQPLLRFTDAGAIPQETTGGEIYVSQTDDANPVVVKALKIEMK